MVGLIYLWLGNPLLVGVTIAVLIYLDLTLTRKSLHLAQQGFLKHVQHETMELNPLFQETIHKDKPIPSKAYRNWFIAIIFSVGASLWIFATYLLLHSDRPSFLLGALIAELLLGLLLVLYLEVNLNHLMNIHIFRLVRDNPTYLSGQITINSAATYGLSAVSHKKPMFFWGLMFLFTGHVFFIGGILANELMRRKLPEWRREPDPVLFEKMCETCIEVFPVDFNHCPHCGRPVLFKRRKEEEVSD